MGQELIGQSLRPRARGSRPMGIPTSRRPERGGVDNTATGATLRQRRANRPAGFLFSENCKPEEAELNTSTDRPTPVTHAARKNRKLTVLLAFAPL